MQLIKPLRRVVVRVEKFFPWLSDQHVFCAFEQFVQKSSTYTRYV